MGPFDILVELCQLFMSIASGTPTEASIRICYLWPLQRQTQEFNYPQVRMNKIGLTFFKVDKARWASDFLIQFLAT